MMTGMEKVKYDGAEVQLQNMTLILPPLNFKAFRQGALKKLQLVIDGMKKLEGGDEVDIPEEVIEAAIDITYLSAVRNYPEITKEQIEDGLDFDSLMKVIPVLITRNNLATVKEFSDQIKNE
jgi:hypothetical protein